jgi:hypothetical protein
MDGSAARQRGRRVEVTIELRWPLFVEGAVPKLFKTSALPSQRMWSSQLPNFLRSYPLLQEAIDRLDRKLFRAEWVLSARNVILIRPLPLDALNLVKGP